MRFMKQPTRLSCLNGTTPFRKGIVELLTWRPGTLSTNSKTVPIKPPHVLLRKEGGNSNGWWFRRRDWHARRSRLERGSIRVENPFGEYQSRKV
jgi:hypothetical protein